MSYVLDIDSRESRNCNHDLCFSSKLLARAADRAPNSTVSSTRAFAVVVVVVVVCVVVARAAMAANFWTSSHSRLLFTAEEVDASNRLDVAHGAAGEPPAMSSVQARQLRSFFSSYIFEMGRLCKVQSVRTRTSNQCATTPAHAVRALEACQTHPTTRHDTTRPT